MATKKVVCSHCRDTELIMIEGQPVQCGSNICQRNREERISRRVLHEMQAWIAGRERRQRALGAKP